MIFNKFHSIIKSVLENTIVFPIYKNFLTSLQELNKLINLIDNIILLKYTFFKIILKIIGSHHLTFFT